MPFVGKQNIGVAVRLAGITAAADFHALNAKFLEFCKRLVKRDAGIQIGKYTKFHKKNSFNFVFNCIIQEKTPHCNSLPIF